LPANICFLVAIQAFRSSSTETWVPPEELVSGAVFGFSAPSVSDDPVFDGVFALFGDAGFVGAGFTDAGLASSASIAADAIPVSPTARRHARARIGAFPDSFMTIDATSILIAKIGDRPPPRKASGQRALLVGPACLEGR
jgi:hypothetical protein